MDPSTHQRKAGRGLGVWGLAARQHGVIAHAQLRDLGVSPDGIRHRVGSGRLHPIHRGVYAVGRPEVTRRGDWMAAVLACGEVALLSHRSAGALWGITEDRPGPDDVSVWPGSHRRHPGIRLHRRVWLASERASVPELGREISDREAGVPVTTPAMTLVDLASVLGGRDLEAAVNAADAEGLVDPVRVRSWADRVPRSPGAGRLRRLLDSKTFRLTDSELERRLLRLARKAGLPPPQTGARLNGFRVDFFWPELGLVVETDGLRYHRTPAQQARDRERDQAHVAAGLTCLRFTHAQVRYEPARVAAVLARVAKRLAQG